MKHKRLLLIFLLLNPYHLLSDGCTSHYKVDIKSDGTKVYPQIVVTNDNIKRIENIANSFNLEINKSLQETNQSLQFIAKTLDPKVFAYGLGGASLMYAGGKALTNKPQTPLDYAIGIGLIAAGLVTIAFSRSS